MEADNKQNIVSLWLTWHFYEMPKFLIGVWKNYILFVSNYFSLTDLLKSFFAPWRRYSWRYPKGFDVGGWISAFLSNVFSRFMGALMRIVLILLGIISQILVVVFGLVLILLWLVVPFIVIFGFFFIFLY